MVKTENITINGKEFKKTYSDVEYYIQKVGTQEVYAEAIDIPSANYEYEETNKKIEKHERKERQ